MALLLDAGGLIGYDQRNPTVVAMIELAQRQKVPVRTTTGVVAQVWRDGSRQARLARLLAGVDEREFTVTASRRVGALLCAAETADVIDASLIDIALDGDEIITTDSGDLVTRATAARKRLTILQVSS